MILDFDLSFINIKLAILITKMTAAKINANKRKKGTPVYGAVANRIYTLGMMLKILATTITVFQMDFSEPPFVSVFMYNFHPVLKIERMLPLHKMAVHIINYLRLSQSDYIMDATTIKQSSFPNPLRISNHCNLRVFRKLFCLKTRKMCCPETPIITLQDFEVCHTVVCLYYRPVDKKTEDNNSYHYYPNNKRNS